MKVSLREDVLRFRAPVVAAWGELRERRVLVLGLQDETTGRVGHGEAAPLEGYDGVPLAAVREALEDCRQLLEAGTPEVPRADLLAACRERAVLPAAVAAVDGALWELAGGAPRGSLGRIAVNATIAAEDRAGAASAAAAARAAGFRCVKLKVGVGDDAGRVAAVRAAAGPDVALRLDANGAWEVEEAIATLRALAPAGIELCEEPVHGVEALGAVRAAGTGVPIAMDETARAPGAIDSGATELVCLKVAAQGGLSGVLAAASRARAAGAEVYVASTYDGPLGIAAGLRAASRLGVERACGLATLDLFAAPSPYPVVDGTIVVP